MKTYKDWNELSGKEFNLRVGKSPDSWDGLSRILLNASEEIERVWMLAQWRGKRYWRKRMKGIALSETEREREEVLGEQQQLHRVAEMLRAMSLECLLKREVYKRRISEKGHADDVDILMSHDLVTLAEQAGATLLEEDKHNLRWQEAMLQLGRFPVAFHPTKQHPVTAFSTSKRAAVKIRERILELIPATGS